MRNGEGLQNTHFSPSKITLRKRTVKVDPTNTPGKTMIRRAMANMA
jgi:hypothetical protein